MLSVTRLAPTQHLYDLPAPWVAYDAVRKQLAELPSLPYAKNEAPLTLSRERAHAMHRELGKLGLKPDAQYALASRVLDREVKSFTALSENEALAVWNAVKRQTQRGSDGRYAGRLSNARRRDADDVEARAVLG